MAKRKPKKTRTILDDFRELVQMKPTDQDRFHAEMVAKGQPLMKGDIRNDDGMVVTDKEIVGVVVRSLSRIVLEQRVEIDMLKAQVQRLTARLPVSTSSVSFKWNEMMENRTASAKEVVANPHNDQLGTVTSGAMRLVLLEIMDRLEGLR